MWVALFQHLGARLTYQSDFSKEKLVLKNSNVLEEQC